MDRVNNHCRYSLMVKLKKVTKNMNNTNYKAGTMNYRTVELKMPPREVTPTMDIRAINIDIVRNCTPVKKSPPPWIFLISLNKCKSYT